jgi:hypothetical protein
MYLEIGYLARPIASQLRRGRTAQEGATRQEDGAAHAWAERTGRVELGTSKGKFKRDAEGGRRVGDVGRRADLWTSGKRRGGQRSALPNPAAAKPMGPTA